VAALEATVRQLRLELRAAEVREEIALVLPHLRHRTDRAKKAKRRKGGRRKLTGKSGEFSGCGPSDQGRRPGRSGGGGSPDNGRPGNANGPCAPGRWPSPAGLLAGGCPCQKRRACWA
jgi:hypothetical protein